MLSYKGRGLAIKVIAVVALTFTLSAIGSSSASADSSTGSISGTVTATNGSPLDNVTVKAMSLSTIVASTTTAVDGTYTLNGLSPDNYSVYFVTCNGSFFCGEATANSFYGSSPQDTVPVTANSVTSGIDVALTITPSIVGTVTAASDGQPISDAVVYAYASGSNFGDVVGITSTGPDGGYMLTNLPDGNYDIVFIDCGDAYPYSSASVCQYAPEVYTGNIGGTPWARDDSPSITLIAVNGGQVAQNVNAALYAVTSPWLVCPPDNAGACELSPATAGMTVTGSALPDPDADLPGAVLNPSVIPGGSLQFVPTDLSGGQFTNSQLPSGRASIRLQAYSRSRETKTPAPLLSRLSTSRLQARKRLLTLASMSIGTRFRVKFLVRPSSISRRPRVTQSPPGLRHQPSTGQHW